MSNAFDVCQNLVKDFKINLHKLQCFPFTYEELSNCIVSGLYIRVHCSCSQSFVDFSFLAMS